MPSRIECTGIVLLHFISFVAVLSHEHWLKRVNVMIWFYLDGTAHRAYRYSPHPLPFPADAVMSEAKREKGGGIVSGSNACLFRCDLVLYLRKGQLDRWGGLLRLTGQVGIL